MPKKETDKKSDQTKKAEATAQQKKTSTKGRKPGVDDIDETGGGAPENASGSS